MFATADTAGIGRRHRVELPEFDKSERLDDRNRGARDGRDPGVCRRTIEARAAPAFVAQQQRCRHCPLPCQAAASAASQPECRFARRATASAGVRRLSRVPRCSTHGVAVWHYGCCPGASEPPLGDRHVRPALDQRETQQRRDGHRTGRPHEGAGVARTTRKERSYARQGGSYSVSAVVAVTLGLLNVPSYHAQPSPDIEKSECRT
jgi:hypothetical protein